MSRGCDLVRHPRACVITQEKYRRPDCEGCEVGRDNVRIEAAKAPVPAAPAANLSKDQKEVAEVSAKEKILAVIQRKGPCVSTPILQSGVVKAAELQRIVRELEQEGKIKVWPEGRKVLFTVAGAPDPRGPGKVSPAKPKNDATGPSKPPRPVNRKPAAGRSLPKNGGGAHATCGRGRPLRARASRLRRCPGRPGTAPRPDHRRDRRDARARVGGRP